MYFPKMKPRKQRGVAISFLRWVVAGPRAA
jgi:hypothetical protein